jgi:Golgi SNAP receptor complex protein 2
MEGGGGTLSEIHQTARKLLLRTRDGLERLERLEYSNSSSSSSSSPSDFSFSVSKDIAQIQSLCVDMDRLSRSIGAKSQRDLWKRFTRLFAFSIALFLYLNRSIMLTEF